MVGLLPYERKRLASLQEAIDNGFKLRIDVGLSHSMPYALKWASTDKQIVVMGFEPHLGNFYECEKLLYQTSENLSQRIFLFNFALTNLDDFAELEFWATKSVMEGIDTGRSSLLEPQKDYQGWIKERYIVRTAPIFKFLDELELQQIEFLKVDTQGFDLRVLRGFRENLKKVLMIMVEADSTEYYKGANNDIEVKNYLSTYGFSKIKELVSRKQKSEAPSDFIFLNSTITTYTQVPRPMNYHFRYNPIQFIYIVMKKPHEFSVALISSSKTSLGSLLWKLRKYLS